jgi:protein-tyrosine-phosphatase
VEKKEGKFKVLFVCTGNTCRSPMAAGLMNKLLSETDFDGIEVGSAGTGALNGWPAAPHALEVTKNWGIDISAHRSRALDKGIVEAADLILCMTLEHHRATRQLSANSGRKSYLLASYPQKPEETPLARIEDPMGGDLEVYEKAFMRIDEHLRRIFGDILEKARKHEL